MEINIEVIEHNPLIPRMMMEWVELVNDHWKEKTVGTISKKIARKMQMIDTMDREEVLYLLDDFVDVIGLYYKDIKSNYT